MDADRLRRAVDALIYAPRLAGTPDAAAPALAAVAAAARARTGRDPRPAVRPWSRDDLFRRVASFRAATWFAKPPGATPLDAAARGWANVGVDLLECESCGARLSFPLPPDMTADELKEAATSLHARLATAHHAHCLWREAACDASLAEFPPVTAAAAGAAFAARLAAARALDCLPELAPGWRDAAAAAGCGDALETLLQRGPQADDDGGAAAAPAPLEPPPPHHAGIAHAAGESAAEFNRRATLIALYGLAAKPLAPGPRRARGAALVCDLCGGAAGLWAHVPAPACTGDDEDGAAAATDSPPPESPPPAKRTRAAAAAAAAAPPSTTSPWRGAAAAAAPVPLDLAAVHRRQCPWVAPAARGGRVGWRWVLGLLVPPAADGDTDGEDDGPAAAATPTSPATDRLRAVLARAGLAAPAAGARPPRADVLTVAGALVE